jgi:signal transduction histidine kinase
LTVDPSLVGVRNEIVKHMSGEICVKSGPSGTTFTIDLPVDG